MPNRILVTGTVAYDHLFSYDSSFLENLRHVTEMEVLSVSFYTHAYAKRLGGTGANMAWNLRLLERDPLLVAGVGSDGREYVDLLRKADIDISHIAVHEKELTATGMCCTDTRQHQIWFFHRGADKAGAWPDLRDVEHDIVYAIVGQRHCPMMMAAVRWCREHDVPMLFDPGQEIRNLTQEDLVEAVEASTGIIANEYEWTMLNERLRCTPEELAKRVDYFILTQAERGFTIYTKRGAQAYSRCNCDTFVNPTGSGDAFRAGLLSGLTTGWDLATSCQLGAALASFVVEQEGARLDAIDINTVYARAKKTYGIDLPQLPKIRA